LSIPVISKLHVYSAGLFLFQRFGYLCAGLVIEKPPPKKKIMKRKKMLLIALMGLATIPVLIAQTTSSTKKPVTSNSSDVKGQVGIEVGNQAPEINLQTPEGKPLALSSLRGNIVLIDFWASWCGPCRMENPNVVSAYKKYKGAKYEHAKGFTIYSVSLDKAKENWMQAIAQDHLEWTNHVSDLKWWYSDAAKSYGVQSIPTNWLLDENGIIVAKNLRGGALDEALDKLVKK
jgi:thiol-disulfide isomerase/thioredoxin